MENRRRKRRLSQKARRRKQQRIAKLCALAVGTALVVCIVVYASLYRSVNKADKKVICDNVYIGETNVSKMTEKEAKKAVKAQLAKYGEQKLTLQVEKKKADVRLGDMGLDVKDMDALVKQAVSYGKKGSLVSRYFQQRKLKKEKKVFTPVFCFAEKSAAAVIGKEADLLENPAKDATIKRTKDGFAITEEADGKAIHIEKSRKKIETYLNEKWNHKEGTVKLVLETSKPKIKKKDLESIQDELGSYSTDAGSGDRVQNLVRGAELLNGTVLMPGQEFSVEQATLPYTLENGYVDGGAFADGEIVQSIAGGICQVSTTLYNAILYAEVEVTRRNNHSMSVSYVQPSRDAAIAEGILDFQFKNNYDTPILIEGYIDDANQLQFHIYGKETRPEGRTVKFESEVLETVPASTKYVADYDNSIGYMESKGTPIDGSTARLWKIVYQDGEEVSRDVINNSTYSPADVKIMVGVASDNAEASQIVANAIGTQDAGAIQEAIGRAQTMAAGL